MTEHILKTLEPYFKAVLDGRKNFEVRRDDRGFQAGDVLRLRCLHKHIVTGELQLLMTSHGVDAQPVEVRKRVTYILTGGQFGIEPGYVVMGLEEE